MGVANRGRWRWSLGLRALGTAVALVAAALIAAGCSSSLLSSSSPQDAEIAELERQLLEERKRATVGEVEAARLQREVVRLQAELEKARTVVTEQAAPPPPATAAVAGDEPTIEDLPVIEVTDLEDQPIDPAPPAPVAVAPAGPIAPAPAGSAAPAAAEEQPAPAAEPPPEAQILYDQGYTLFNQGRYADAETRFRRYVEQYPRSELADNAMFWIGECRYARGDFSSALGAFSDTVERYPDGNKVGDALLKAGKCLEALGNEEQARSTYEEVVRRYPGTAAAALARDRLAALQG